VLTSSTWPRPWSSDPADYPQGREGRHDPTRSARRPSRRPSRLRAYGRAAVPRCGRAKVGPARRCEGGPLGSPGAPRSPSTSARTAAACVHYRCPGRRPSFRSPSPLSGVVMGFLCGARTPSARLLTETESAIGVARFMVRAGCCQRLRWRRRARSSSVISAVGSCPWRSPTRSTSTERTCSACALESRGRPVWRAGSRTWNG
jgi:hypothetical protein